jgi:hypothetical protein
LLSVVYRCVPSQYFWQRPDMASSGFCLLNTVGVAAVSYHDVLVSGASQETTDKRCDVFVLQAYARHHYGRSAWRDHTLQANPVVASGGDANTERQHREYRAPRIAIVDIDIHHGTHTGAYILPHEHL